MFNRSALRVVAALLISLVRVSCGGGESEHDVDAVSNAVIEETGTLDGSDQRDPDHSDLTFDPFLFEAGAFNEVHLAVTAETFLPMLKLIEVSTGAVLAEWDSEYADDDMLRYTIAAAGVYEARIYSTDGLEGDYTLLITIQQ